MAFAFASPGYFIGISFFSWTLGRVVSSIWHLLRKPLCMSCLSALRLKHKRQIIRSINIYQTSHLHISCTSRFEASIGTGTTQLQGSRVARAMALGESGYGRHRSKQSGHPCIIGSNGIRRCRHRHVYCKEKSNCELFKSWCCGGQFLVQSKATNSARVFFLSILA